MVIEKAKVEFIVEANDDIPNSKSYDFVFSGIQMDNDYMLVESIDKIEKVDDKTYKLEALVENYSDSMMELFMKTCKDNELILYPEGTVQVNIKEFGKI